MTKLRIGTRQSQLALWQANHVRAELEARYSDLDVELVGITSAGDKTLDVPLAQVGGKGLFLKELEEALVAGQVDIAVHSMKDVTVSLPDGLHIPVICEREDPRDAFVSNNHQSLDELPPGAVVGTCSLRRQASLRYHYPHLDVRNLRGNVNTRLGRLDAGDYDAIVLAVSGLLRLGMADRIRAELDVDRFLPAVGQGALGIECRVDDAAMNERVSVLNHPDTALCVSAERALNAALDGGCHVPVAAYAELDADGLRLRGRVGEPDGSRLLRSEGRAARNDGIGLADRLAEDLKAQGATEILGRVYG